MINGGSNLVQSLFSGKLNIAAANCAKSVTGKYFPILFTVYCKVNFTGAFLVCQLCSQFEKIRNE